MFNAGHGRYRILDLIGKKTIFSKKQLEKIGLGLLPVLATDPFIKIPEGT